MTDTDNFFKLDRLLRSSRYPVPIARICEHLECSESTAHRVIRDMRNEWLAPIESCRKPPGYRYSRDSWDIPGHRLLPDEAHAMRGGLCLMKGKLPGYFDDLLVPLVRRLDQLPESKNIVAEAARRFRFASAGAMLPGPALGPVSSANWQRRRLSFYYGAPGTKKTRREVSPQTVLDYRDRVYLDAWCHRDEKIKTFKMHWIERAVMLDTPAIDVPEADLRKEFEAAYGIFSGPATAIAIIRISARLVPWIEGAIWHPKQEVSKTKAGDLILKFPIGRTEELVQDVMRYGPDAEVIEPPSLREEVARQLWQAAMQYRREEGGEVG